MPTVTLDLPEALLEHARREARAAREPLESYLARQLPQAREKQADTAPSAAWDQVDLTGLADEQLRVHIHARLPEETEQRLSELQARNSEGKLSAAEIEEFDRLLRVLHSNTMLKALALLAWKTRHGSLPPGFDRLP